MYTNSNNRIITKYTEFLQQQNEQTLEPLKRVNSSHFSASADEHELLSDSSTSSGDENANANSKNKHFSSSRAKTIISAEIHHTEEEVRGELIEPEPVVPPVSPEPEPDSIPFPITSQLKFSDIFTPAESHALFQRSLFLKSEAGRFLAEANAVHAKSKSDSDLVVLASKISSRASAEGISRGPPESGDDDYPVRPLNPHPNPGNYSASSSLADLTSMSMRRELLSNIRAISRATFFENLYVGTGAPPEAPKAKSLQNDALLQPSDNHRPQTVVSERGELLVFEKQSPDSASKRETIDLWIKSSHENLSTSYPVHEHENGIEPELPETTEFKYSNSGVAEILELNDSDSNALNVQHVLEREGDLEFAEQSGNLHDSASVEDNQEYFQPDEPEQVTDILVITGSIEEYRPDELPDPDNIPDVGPNFLEKTDSSDSYADDPRTPPKFQPIFSRVESPAIEPDPRASRNRQNTPKHSYLSNILKPSLTNGFSKQVRYPSVLPKRSPILYDSRRSRRVGKLPGILRRQNMDQWVAKIVWFYINGDEHFPKFEYRFRPGRDVRSWDGLCDILSNRLKLTRGVRFIFSTGGVPINSVEDLRHEGSYVVSSVKKFKALNYGGELLSPDDDDLDDLKRRPPSAPTQRKPPIIRIRRERSLNGVSWGSPQQQLSGSETNNNNSIGTGSKSGRPSLTASALEAEKVLTEVIGQARPVEKRVVRIINGQDPSIQSQVLLNTKVSQEWVELVKDLGLAVKIPRRLECRMETLTGRQIQSYSQLRSELKAGNQAFYIYTTTQPNAKKISKSGKIINDLSSGIPLHFHSSTSLNKINNCSVSNSNPSLVTRNGRRRRGGGLANSNSNLLQVQESLKTTNSLSGQSFKKSVSSSSIYQPTESSMRKAKSLSLSNNTLLSPATSQQSLAGLQQRRRSTRRRSQASTYLALRSRSPSPEYN